MKTHGQNIWINLPILLAGTFALLLTGCSAGLSPESAVAPMQTKAVSGKVHGGQQPVSGAVIQLYAVGITGLKSAATPLIGATVTTGADGSFNIAGDWDCISNTAAYGTNPLLYLVASGGNPGLAQGTNNSALKMMAALGPCSGIGPSTFIFVDELTTVTAVYALAPFMADTAHVGAQGTNSTGLINAFQVAGLLANITSGTVPGSSTPANASVPVTELNMLADIVAACINSTGSGMECSTLFSATTPVGGAAPSDIVAALLNISANPGAQTAMLFSIANPQSPYQPVLQSAPNDWTVAVKFTGGGLNAPSGIALDASGNAWVANAGGNSVTELSPNGTLLTGASGYTGNNNIFGAQGIAVNNTGNVWLADTLLSSVVKLMLNAGAVQSSTSYTSGGISGPVSVAIDSANNVWVANFAGGSVTELSSQGTPVGVSPLTANSTLQAPGGIAVDSSGNVWVTDNAAAVVAEFANNQTLKSNSGYADSGIIAPIGVALDTSGRAWVAENGSNAVGLFAANGSALLTPPATGGGLNMPAAVAIDGNGTAWVTSRTSIAEIPAAASAPSSPSTGWGVLNQPLGIAIDGSGNIWTANAGDNSVTLFVGLAGPVLTPLAANVGP